MITWTKATDTKGTGEVKRAAQEAIIALFNLNTSIITMKLAELTKEQQVRASTQQLCFIFGRILMKFFIQGTGRESSPKSPAPFV